MDCLPGSRQVSEAEVAPATPAPDRAALDAAYHVEASSIFRTRLLVCGMLFLVAWAIGLVSETSVYPERVPAATRAYVVAAGMWLLGLGLCQRLQPHARAIGTVLAAATAVLLTVYGASVHAVGEYQMVADLSLMYGLPMVLPWGWLSQLVVCSASLGSLLLTAHHLVWNLLPPYAAGILASSAITSMLGAIVLEQYRYSAFIRNALLDHASKLTRDDAEFAQAILDLAQTLDQYLGQEGLAARLNTLATGVFGCDHSFIYLWDAEQRAFRLNAGDTSSETQPTMLARDWPPISSLPPGHLVEIPDTAEPQPVPVAARQALGCSSLLLVPLCRQGKINGIIAFAYQNRTGPFTAKDHRLAFGIAHAAAIALENERTIVRLRTANSLKSEFLSTMSHELRTPLSVVIGYADILVEGGFGALSPAQEDAVGRIAHNAREQLELITATLDLNRLEAGRDEVTLEPIDLEQLFWETRRDLRVAQSELVALRWDNQLPGKLVHSDRLKLKTILKNLVDNALKFTPSGEVMVEAREHNGTLELTVRDTGIGIAEENLPLIFEMFRQVDGSDRRSFGGVGLGLHIVQRFVERLDGHLDVQSELGKGTTFTIQLPGATRI